MSLRRCSGALGSRGCAVAAAQSRDPSNAEVNRGNILEHSGFPAAAIRVRASEGSASCEFCSAVRRLRASVYERVRARAPRKGESREGTTVFVARVGSGALRVTVSDTPRGTCSPSIETRVSQNHNRRRRLYHRVCVCVGSCRIDTDFSGLSLPLCASYIRLKREKRKILQHVLRRPRSGR